MLRALGLTSLHVVEVVHCFQSYGIAITHSAGWKMVYSGDTRPCDSLVEIGRGCDVLLHEATFEDQMTTEAAEKLHSTIKEALEVAARQA